MMSTSSTFCPTCLSDNEEGAKLTEILVNFLCNVLHFKRQLLQNTGEIVCRKCYKTIIEVKCFYNQLRDVEVYLESKTEVITVDSKQNLTDEEETSLPYIGSLECTPSILDEPKMDPIVIEEDEECCVVENNPKKKQKVSKDGKRFVCLMCSKLFHEISQLRAHEQTAHSSQTLQKASPVFLMASFPTAASISCLECGQKFLTKTTLDAHVKQTHRKVPSSPTTASVPCLECGQKFLTKTTLNAHVKQTHRKVSNSLNTTEFLCGVCKQMFGSKDLLLKHQCIYECEICGHKNSSRSELELHMKMKHRRKTNGAYDVVKEGTEEVETITAED